MNKNNIVMINGSYRKNGVCTKVLSALEEFLNKKGSTINIEEIRLASINIGHCRGCRSCKKKGECIQKDDMKTVLEKLGQADLIIIGTPNYFYSVSGLIKDFIDRNLAWYYNSKLKGKDVLGIVCQGGGGSEKVVDTLRSYCSLSKMNLIETLVFNEDPTLDKQKEELIIELEEKLENIPIINQMFH